MKEKILVALKTKYSNLGFGAKALDGVASILEKSVTDESQIETAVSGVEPFLKVFQSDADRARTEYNALKGLYDELKAKGEASPANGGGQGKKNEPGNDSNPQTFDPEAFEERIKSFIQNTMKPYTEKIEGFEAAQTQAQRAATIREKAHALGLDDDTLSIIKIDDNDDVDQVLSKAAKMFVKSGIGVTPPLFGGGESGDKMSAAMAARLDRKKAAEDYKTSAIKGLN